MSTEIVPYLRNEQKTVEDFSTTNLIGIYNLLLKATANHHAFLSGAAALPSSSAYFLFSGPARTSVLLEMR